MKNEVVPAKRPRGRPRSFDRAAALDAAMRLFWRHGYDATPVSALVRAMGLTPPQLYAAFGDKRRLFAEAMDKYQAENDVLGAALAAAPTVREAVARSLREAARALTAPGRPPGCFCVLGAVNCGPDSAEVEADLRRRRARSEEALLRRLESGRDAGELPPEADVAALARFYAGVFNGMSLQARDGASRQDLEQVAALAMAAWPGEAPPADTGRR